MKLTHFFFLAGIVLLLPMPFMMVGVLGLVIAIMGRHAINFARFRYWYALCGLALVVSILHQNWIGLMNVAGFVGLGILCDYALAKRLDVDRMMDFMIVASLVLTIYGLVEFYGYSVAKGYAFFAFHVQNSPRFRIHTTLYNANIYATYIELVLCFCGYRYFCENKKRWWYLPVVAINVFMLWLTGCRAAFLPMGLALIILLVAAKEYKWLAGVGVLAIAGIAVLLAKPKLSSRLSDVTTITSRFKIWKTAIKGILAHPFFGYGPQGYGHIYPILHGHKAPHAHNLYLDVLLNFGLVGTGLFILQIKEMVKHWKEQDRLYKGLIAAIVVTILVHGLVDVTFNYVTTGLLAAIILLHQNERIL